VREKISVLSRWRHQRLNSLDEASQWTSVRATNAIERLHEEFKRRIKTQAFLSNAETAALDLARLSANRHAKGRRLAKSRNSPGRQIGQATRMSAVRRAGSAVKV
jgi:transposase-like protein